MKQYIAETGMNYGTTLGAFVVYPDGAVYLRESMRLIGHQVIPGVVGLDKPGEGCGAAWRIERDPDACRRFDQEVAHG